MTAILVDPVVQPALLARAKAAHIIEYSKAVRAVPDVLNIIRRNKIRDDRSNNKITTVQATHRHRLLPARSGHLTNITIIVMI